MLERRRNSSRSPHSSRSLSPLSSLRALSRALLHRLRAPLRLCLPSPSFPLALSALPPFPCQSAQYRWVATSIQFPPSSSHEVSRPVDMGKRLKEQCEWVESVGYSSNGWIGGDWHTPLHLLSKLLAGELEQRKETVESDCCESDVTLKISFDSLLQLAEDTLGVPVLITERDLLTRYPNIHLALVTYLICLRNTIDHIDPKLVRNTKAPRLIFEAKNGLHSSLPSCPECNEHVFIIERVVVERVVYHRQCLKCTECSKLLSRGAFKRTKNGFECISHAVRRILDAHESSSSSGSGTYDRYGYSGRSPRPAVAPPPRPKPRPPPKPAYLSSARADRDYESLDEIQASVAQPIHPSPIVPSPVEDLCEKEEVVAKQESDERNNPFEETEKKAVEKDTSDTTSTRSNPGSESYSASADDASSGDSVDSGVVMRMAKLFGEVDAGRGSERARISQPQICSPVPPPRPKRTSMLITSSTRSHSASPSPSANRTPLKNPAPSPAPKPRLNLEDYPGYLCPFGEEEEMSEDYPSGKNPFADSDDESTKGPPVPAPRSLPPPVPVLPGTSDRPKVQPPPPPPGAQVDPSTPPPKPPRSGLNASETRIHTLRISRKKFRAPLPPVPQMRKINFTENGVKEEPAIIAKRLKEIEEQMTRVEIEGRAVEKEMLFQIDTNPRTWTKSQRTDDWVIILTKKLELMREQLYLLGLWRENYLNEVHSETEYYIRCLLEKEKIDKSEWEIEREATLTNLLIYIIDEKLKLDEYMVDHAGDNSELKKDEKADQKKNKLKSRVRMLSQRLKSKKSKEPKTEAGV